MPLPTTPKTPPKAVQAAELRWRLLHLRARYDDGAVAPAVYRVIREIETDLAWLQQMSTAANWRVPEHALIDSFRSQGAHVEDADGDFLLPIIIETFWSNAMNLFRCSVTSIERSKRSRGGSFFPAGQGSSLIHSTALGAAT
jgi:hypothetical protein